MIHTIAIRAEINYPQLRYMDNTFENRTANNIIQTKFKGITARVFRKVKFKPSINLVIDVTKLLGKGDITEKDFNKVNSVLISIFGYLFNDNSIFQNLTRYDYRVDVFVPEADKRELYMDLFKKSYKKVFHLVKKVYPSTVYHKSKSLEVIVYDKTIEREKKGQSEEWEKDRIRFEVRLMNPHIYNRMRRTGETKELETYFKESMFLEYVNKYLKGIYFTGDYYTYNKAIQKIKESKFSVKKKQGLQQFLLLVTKDDMSFPKTKIKEQTFRSRIKDLETIGLNPITIPRRKSNQYSELPNLLKSLYQN